MRIFLAVGIAIASILSSSSQNISKVVSSVDEDAFSSPDSTYHSGVWWWWLRCQTSKEAITRDLEEMKAQKIQRVIHSDFGVSGDKPRLDEYDYLEIGTEKWYELVRHSIRECHRLGLDFGMCIEGGGPAAPWVTPDEGLQKLVFAEIKVEGPTEFNTLLPYPPDIKIGEVGMPVFYHDISIMLMPDKKVVTTKEIRDISTQLRQHGKLDMDVPDGKWKIIRMGYKPTYKGWDVNSHLDISRTGVYSAYYKKYIGNILEGLTKDERKAVKIIESDSYEGGMAEWNVKFIDSFRHLRGYDPAPYLPVLAGQTIGSKEISERFMYDYKQTVSYLFEEHYRYMQEMAHSDGMLSMYEASGPHQHWADALLLQKYADLPMGEFWAPAKTHRTTLETRFLAKEAASAAHIYGKRIVPAESFTSIGPQWEESPYTLKSTADRAFCDGVNQIYFHTFSQSPSLTAKPGYVYYAGSHFNQNITWWEYAYDWLSYLTRCQYMLQQGLPFADVCFYYGDGIGNRKHYRQEVCLTGKSFLYDYTNSDALLERMSVYDGKVVLPDGVSYNVLVLPDKNSIPLEVLEKIRDMVKQGATIIGQKPEKSTGLMDYRTNDRRLKIIADELWGKDTGAVVDRKVGKGRVVLGKSIPEVLADNNVLPDMEYKSGCDSSDIDFIHRTDGDTEIYFLANLIEQTDSVKATFRITGKYPQLWDATDGNVSDITEFVDDGKRISIPLCLAPFGSMFVIFRDNKTGKAAEVFDFKSARVYNITAPWEVSFDKEWGGPEHVIFDKLVPWNESKEDGIKYYSGTAVYRTRFKLSSIQCSKTSNIYLDLGEMYNIAEVWVNGKNLGTCWKKPYRKDIKRAMVDGENVLELRVTNLWPNRLIGDQFLPKAERFTETNITKFTKDSPLRTSGLVGPVRLYYEEY